MLSWTLAEMVLLGRRCTEALDLPQAGTSEMSRAHTSAYCTEQGHDDRDEPHDTLRESLTRARQFLQSISIWIEN